MNAHPPPGWTVVDGALERQFAFANFAEALAFVNRVGAAAEDADHYPDVLMHGYKLVTVRWRTHSADAITDKDHDLASRCNQLVES